MHPLLPATKPPAPGAADLLGVVLAAGKGTRIRPFSERWPKPVLPVLGRPLIEWQVESLAALGVREVLVVIGHLGFEIVRALGVGERFGVRIRYVDQGPTLGIAHALGQLEPHVDRPFMLLLGDIVFVRTDLAAMVEVFGARARGVLAVKPEDDPAAIRRNFVVVEDAAGRVTRVIEKPRHPPTRLKGCGLYLFDPTVFDAVRRTPRSAMRDEYEITDAIQIFLDDGHEVRACRCVEDDLNLSYPEDLLAINLALLGEDVLLGDGVRLPAGSAVERSVVMAGVEADGPVTLRDCLVFPGTRLAAGSRHARRILTPERVVSCG